PLGSWGLRKEWCVASAGKSRGKALQQKMPVWRIRLAALAVSHCGRNGTCERSAGCINYLTVQGASMRPRKLLLLSVALMACVPASTGADARPRVGLFLGAIAGTVGGAMAVRYHRGYARRHHHRHSVRYARRPAPERPAATEPAATPAASPPPQAASGGGETGRGHAGL